jgi:2-dehydropantoate 2-reductase
VVETLLDQLYDNFVLPHTTTTILHDWRKGRHSEVDDLNGHIVTLAGPDAAPVNTAITTIAHRIEHGALEPTPANATLLAELAGVGVA